MNIWCNVKFPATVKSVLRSSIEFDHIAFADESARQHETTENPVPARLPLPNDTDIVFGQPTPQEAMQCANLRWIHLNSAGYTMWDRDDVRQALQKRDCLLTTSSNVYAEPVAQHVLAMMLSVARQLPQAMVNQMTDHGWPSQALRHASRLLNEQKVLILGFGHIARRLSTLLAPFHMEVSAIRRHPQPEEDTIRTFRDQELERLIKSADHLVSTLPGSLETNNYLNRQRLGWMKPDAVLYNVGRGTTMDQSALIQMLQAGRIGAAYLDVTDPEPLPSDHPLWTAPNCYITPHSAGGHEDEGRRLANHFLDNLTRYRRGDTLLSRVIL